LPDLAPGAQGIVYAATGERYVALARRSARALRAVEPDAVIDLYTDQDLADPVFDRVVRLERVSRRPKMEALRRSRFARTLFLDADVLPLASPSPLFPLLDRFDIAAAHELKHTDERNSLQLPGEEVPAAFPAMNSGVILLRAGAATAAFLDAWERRVHDGTHRVDQKLFRALLYRSDLRIGVLPPEWNVLWPAAHLAQGPGFPAPRLLHLPRLHERPPGDPAQPLTVSGALPPPQVRRLAEMIAADPTFGRPPGAGDETYHRVGRARRAARWLAARLRGAI
jgi:hypothetical protein